MALLGCLAWIVVTLYVVLLVRLMIGGEIDGLTGVIGLFMTLGLGLMAFRPPRPDLIALSYLSTGILVLSGLLWPVLQWSFRARSKHEDEIHAISRAYEGFIFRPNNPVAQIRLARHLYNVGIRGHAVALAESALPNLPQAYFPDEYRMVMQWRVQPPPPSAFEPISCQDCGEPNPPGMIHCRKCGARYLLQAARGLSLGSALGRRLLGAWIAMVAVMAALPLTQNLPANLGVVVILGLFALAIAALVVAFRPTAGAA